MTFCLHDTNVIVTFAVSLNDSEQGKMPEWSIGAVSKTVVPLRAPRVRIPVFPQPNRTKSSPEATNRRLSDSSAVFSCLILSIQD